MQFGSVRLAPLLDHSGSGRMHITHDERIPTFAIAVSHAQMCATSNFQSFRCANLVIQACIVHGSLRNDSQAK